MSKEDSAPGLLSKMVKFVRNPATNWGDLDEAQTDREDAMSKQLLKEMIERKRRNDFVRKREFDMLRKLRKREAIAGVGHDPTGRPSFFHSSMPSRQDDRAVTLRKIDEIEAQMSMQWWKTKSSSTGTLEGATQPTSGAARLPSSEDPLHDAQDAHYAPTRPYQATINSANMDTVPMPFDERESPAEVSPLVVPPSRLDPFSSPRPDGREPLRSDRKDGGISTFPPSERLAASVEQVVVHDTELEETAIRFANGDDAGAEAGLREILAPGASRASHLETWLALFDLYRATAQQDKFELSALQFVRHFNRSAPQWFSMPDLVKTLSRQRETSSSAPVPDWICPSVFGIQTLAALKAAMARTGPPWCLDWSNLKSINAAAVESLSGYFRAWADQSVRFCFIGEEQLLFALQSATPSGVRDVAQVWWLLRMEALRVMHRADEFELTALDFCVTYEVSPPAWESARCDYQALDALGTAAGGATIVGDVFQDTRLSTVNPDWDTETDAPISQHGNQMSVELSGHIQEDATAVLDRLELKLMGADTIVISCANLIRVNFSAAGTVLNWVSALESEHRAVHFKDVNRLVAEFFTVIGITEHAKVSVRTD